MGKLSSWPTTFCSALHATKAMVIIIYDVLGAEEPFSLFRAVTLFALSAVIVRVISYDGQQERVVKDVSHALAKKY